MVPGSTKSWLNSYPSHFLYLCPRNSPPTSLLHSTPTVVTIFQRSTWVAKKKCRMIDTFSIEISRKSRPQWRKDRVVEEGDGVLFFARGGGLLCKSKRFTAAGFWSRTFSRVLSYFFGEVCALFTTCSFVFSEVVIYWTELVAQL